MGWLVIGKYSKNHISFKIRGQMYELTKRESMFTIQ